MTGDGAGRVRRIEMARLLGVSTVTLDRWVSEGIYGVRLRAWRIGNTVSFAWADIEAFRQAVESRRPKRKKVTA